MRVDFITPSKLSLLDLTSMGDSSKRGDESKIGRFDSGLKYAIALLLRNKVKIDILVTIPPVEDEPTYRHEYSFKTKNESCQYSDKNKELIVVQEIITSFHEGNPDSLTEEILLHNTSFSINLGFDWELWMAFRELASNCIDENGALYINNLYIDNKKGTTITLRFEDDSDFAKVIKDKDIYLLSEDKFVYNIGSGVQIFDNAEKHLKIYKQRILIYEDKNEISKYCYNISFGDIDERRILKDAYVARQKILDAIMCTSNVEFLDEIIACSDEFWDEKDWINGATWYGETSTYLHNIITDKYKLYGEVYSIKPIIEAEKKREDCVIAGKKLKGIKDHLWSYPSAPTLGKAIPVNTVLTESIKEKIEKKFNFTVQVEIKERELFGGKVGMDKHDECIYVDPSFNVEEDFHLFLVEYFVYTNSENIIITLAKELTKKLKK